VAARCVHASRHICHRNFNVCKCECERVGVHTRNKDYCCERTFLEPVQGLKKCIDRVALCLCLLNVSICECLHSSCPQGSLVLANAKEFLISKSNDLPVPVAARSKALVYGRSTAWIVGSNPTMDVCLL
jgi:hypothetical protein